MRIPIFCAAAFLFAASLHLSAQAVQGTTATSVCHSTGDAGCSGPFNGMAYNGSTFNLPANNGGSAWELSTVPVQPAGSNLQLFVHMTPWFFVNQGNTNYPVPCTSSGCTSNNYVEYDGHVEVGYSSYDPGEVQRQLNDVLSRGFNGLVLDWYGPFADSTENSGGSGNTEDKTAQAMRSAFSGNPFCSGSSCLHYAIVEDQGAWKRTNPNLQFPSCDPNNSTNQTACIESHLEADEGYVNAQYFNNAGYLTIGAQRLIQFFIDDASCCSGWSGADWTSIWQKEYANAKSSYNAAQIFMGPDGFTHYGFTDGSFAWINFNGSADPDLVNNTAYLQNFYNTAANNQSKQIWGASYKGFDERTDQSRPGAFRFVNQKCGQVWLKTIRALRNPATIGAAAISVPYGVVPTWNDYGEGTEIESGIDNCVSSVAAVNATCSGQMCITWNTNFSDTTNGTEQTIAYYRVDVMHADGTWTRGIKTVFPDANGNYTSDQTQPNARFYIIDPSYLNTDQWFFVTAVGLNSVTNHESNNADIHPSVGSVTVSGSEQESFQTVQCGQYNWCQVPKAYDSGTMTVSIGGYSKTVSWGGPSATPNSIATSIANAFNGDSGSPVTASVSSGTVNFLSKSDGSSGNNPVGCTMTWDSTDFYSPSFYTNESGMSGGMGG